MAAYLYSAVPCDATDPAPGVRLLREGVRLNRLSAREALHLAGELITASLAAMAGPAAAGALAMPADEFALARAVWALLEQAGHGDCGGWSFRNGSSAGVLCACGAVVAIPAHPDRSPL